MALFLPIRYLESNGRKSLFENNPPLKVYVSSNRLKCAIEGDFDNAGSAVCYCWIIWQKGYRGETILKWFN